MCKEWGETVTHISVDIQKAEFSGRAWELVMGAVSGGGQLGGWGTGEVYSLSVRILNCEYMTYFYKRC